MTSSSTEIINPLIAIPSPRDIGIVKKNLDSIKGVDRLWVKYLREGDAYKVIQSYFLDHPEYNFLCLIPDDLIVHNDDFQKLVNLIKEKGPENIPTLSGICNVHNVPSYTTQMAFCVDQEVHPQRRRRHWVWEDMRNSHWRERGYDSMDLLPVKFSGFACQFIRRDIVEEIGLHGDAEHNEFDKVQQDYSYDIIFCYLCNHHEPEPIPLYVCPKVKLLHLRGSRESEYPEVYQIKVDKEPPKILFEDSVTGKEKEEEEEEEEDITNAALASYLPKKEEDPLTARNRL